MTQKVQLRGLCKTCIHKGYCSLRLDNGKPVHQCEEFQDEKNPGSRKKKKKNKTGSNNGTLNPDAPMGLCRNCEKFETCTLPQPSGGVWYCEEYE